MASTALFTIPRPFRRIFLPRSLLRCMRWMSFISCAVLLAWCWPRQEDAQQNPWVVRAGAGYAVPDGTFEAQRANGKIVTSDIDAGPLFSVRVERRVSPRIGLTLGGVRSDHDFIIHQDFPDGTAFEARDSFRFQAITAGVAFHWFEGRGAHFIVEPYFLFAWYDDVSLDSAGPPFDRTDPIDVAVESRPGVGVIAGLEIPIAGSSFSFNPWVGIAAVRFSGPFPDDPSIPGSDGEIGVSLAPLSLGVSVGLHF